MAQQRDAARSPTARSGADIQRPDGNGILDAIKALKQDEGRLDRMGHSVQSVPTMLHVGAGGWHHGNRMEKPSCVKW